jgi:hypothetical protein
MFRWSSNEPASLTLYRLISSAESRSRRGIGRWFYLLIDTV